MPPCRSFCEYVRAGCEDDLLELNLDWPSHLDCEQYPVIGDNTVCFGPANPNALTIPPIDITDPPTPPDLPVKQGVCLRKLSVVELNTGSFAVILATV